MKQAISLLLLLFFMASNSHAAVWVKLHEDNTSKLMLDKQSVLHKDLLKRAWVKIEYKVPQKNLQSPASFQSLDKEYNLAKLLWFFDCAAQKSATSQVFQYLNDDLIFSAAIDSKSAEFVEPVPETDVDRAMRYVCLTDMQSGPLVGAKSGVAKAKASTGKPDGAAKKAETPQEPAIENPEPTTAKAEVKAGTPTTKVKSEKAGAHKLNWAYEGKEGPENWGKLSPEYTACDAGRNQSPINIEETLHAVLKPLRSIQKFPAKDIVNNGHTVQVNFKEGNMMVLDNSAYQMKQVHFHAPSENKIYGKSYPLEAHFVHADAKGNLTVIGVMFKEGGANVGLEKLWTQMPSMVSDAVVLKVRVIPSELMPVNRSYYRFSGSLTTPPCSEGVRWILLKTPVTASKEQLEAIEKALHHHNNRPVQALNGRVVLE